MKLKFHQMKVTDVARTIESEIAGIKLAEIVEIERFVDAVFSFVDVVILIIYLIDFCVDVLIVSVVALIAMKKFLVFNVIKANLMIIKN